MFLSRRTAVVLVVIAAAALGLGLHAAFGRSGADHEPGGTRVVQPGAPGQPGRTLSADELASLKPPTHTAADIQFMRRMIPHHTQALDMVALVTGRSQSPDVPLLAERIAVSQRDEITQMERWLKERGEATPAPHADHDRHDTLMPGMLNTEELGRLERARGADFDRLFLQFMIRHHQGALTMVQELYAAGGGLESAADRFAREVNADQGIEIRRMQDMLAKLG